MCWIFRLFSYRKITLTMRFFALCEILTIAIGWKNVKTKGEKISSEKVTPLQYIH